MILLSEKMSRRRPERPFDGENTQVPINSYFAGDSTTKKEATETDAPFAEDNSKTAKDGVFIGQDIDKATDGTFVGNSYGK